jgi:hypothetical protein
MGLHGLLTGIVKSRRLLWAGLVVRIGDTRNAYSVLSFVGGWRKSLIEDQGDERLARIWMFLRQVFWMGYGCS